MPVHMACLSGYSDCVENIIPRGIWVCVHVCEKGKVPKHQEGKELMIHYFPSPSSPFLPSLLLPSLPSQAIVLPQKLMMRIELASMLQHVEGRTLNSVALYMHTYVLHVNFYSLLSIENFLLASHQVSPFLHQEHRVCGHDDRGRLPDQCKGQAGTHAPPLCSCHCPIPMCTLPGCQRSHADCPRQVQPHPPALCCCSRQ